MRKIADDSGLDCPSPPQGIDAAEPSPGRRVLIVEDESSLRHGLGTIFRNRGYDVALAGNGWEALQELSRGNYALVVTDLRMPEMDGLTLIRRIREIAPETLVLVATAHASVDTALEAMREGAADYLCKPLPWPEIVERVRHLLEWRELVWENRRLRREAQLRPEDAPFLIYRSAAIERIMRLARQVAGTNSTVLITGESGVGKEVVARAIHDFSANRNEVFLPINCSALPDHLIESQLFGHAKGSFTGADSAHEGLFHRARGGTIFLDEIGELPLHLQVKLLRAIEHKEILPIGTTRPVRIEVRVIAATNLDLRQAVEARTFREDLYYRLNVVRIEIPPLRDRREDIPPLVDFLVRRHNERLRQSYKGVDNQTLTTLILASWRGNVRELDNAIEYAMIVGNGEWITIDDLPPGTIGDPAKAGTSAEGLTETLRRFEKVHIENVLLRLNNDRRAAAQVLQIDLSTLYRKIKELGIDVNSRSNSAA